MERQNEQTDAMLDQMRLEQRAWVGVLNAKLEPELGKPLRWRMHLSNSGQTPALLERIEYNMVRLPDGVDFDPEAIKLVATVDLQQSLAPGASPLGVPFRTLNNVVDQRLLEFISNAQATERIYVVGRVHYEDVAGAKRETEFSFVSQPGSGELSFHHNHNTMR
jgi:hypothetical protein